MLLKNLKVIQKLLIMAGVSALLLLVTAGVAFFGMRSMNDSTAALYKDRVVPMTYLNDMTRIVGLFRSNLIKYAMVPDAAERQQIRADMEKQEGELQKAITSFEATTLTSDERKSLADFKTAWATYTEARKQPMQTSDAGQQELARQQLKTGPSVQSFTNANQALTDLLRMNEQNAADLNESVAQENRQSLLVMGVAVAVALVILLGGNLITARAIALPLKKAAEHASRMAEGDLTGDGLQSDSRDEIGELARAFSQMQKTLRHFIGSVSEGTQTVTAATDQLSGAAQQAAGAATAAATGADHVTGGANEQAQATVEADRTMGELQTTIQQIASGAGKSAEEVQKASQMLAEMVVALDGVVSSATGVSEDARKAAERSKGGAVVVADTLSSMQRIQTTSGHAADQISRLAQLSSQIGEITETISNIADQTNLLALNAAIEAARAGEHGRGFAVVADEVRKLAERSAASAREISGLIGNVQAGTSDAVKAMQAGMSEVEQGTKLAQEAGSALEEILETVEGAALEITKVAEGATEVRKNSESVVSAFDNMAAVTEENTAATEEMAAGTEQVKQLIDRVANLARENAQTAGEVSTSTQELSAAGAQVASSAQDLAKIAHSLEEQVKHFNV